MYSLFTFSESTSIKDALIVPAVIELAFRLETVTFEQSSVPDVIALAERLETVIREQSNVPPLILLATAYRS